MRVRGRPAASGPPALLGAALAAVLAVAACGEGGGRDGAASSGAASSGGAAEVSAAGVGYGTRSGVEAGVRTPIPDSVFGRLVRELSEPDRYFDTDNLISNESSYLHVVDGLEERGIEGGVYLGVGPGQNFSYMAVVRPTLAFLVDIRRDNLLQHLWYKALFERSESRLDYLCALTARACGGPSGSLSVVELVARVDSAPPVDTLDALVAAVVEAAATAGVELSGEDRAFIGSIQRRFAEEGPGLRFNTHGRPPRAYYPTLRQLLLERDRSGRRAGYLATEDGYRWLAELQRRNRVVPVVGDVAGDHAVRAIGREIERRGGRVSAFYVSNVEFYLFGEGHYPAFVDNLRSLPVRDDAVLIRSYFNRFRPVPGTVPGYASTQLLHGVPALLAQWEAGRIRSYRELLALSTP